MQVQKIKAGKFTLHHINDREIQPVIESLPPSHLDFLQEQQFVIYGGFQYENFPVILWQQRQTSRYLALINYQTLEFLTILTDSISLTSSNKLDNFCSPEVHGYFYQQLTTDNLTELWQYHLAGETFLENEYSIPNCGTDYTIDIEQFLKTRIMQQVKLIDRIPFYWLRVPYWLYVQIYKCNGVPIAEQLTNPRYKHLYRVI